MKKKGVKLNKLSEKIILYVTQSDLENLEKCINDDENVLESIDNYSRTLVHIATINNKIEILELLIKLNAKLNVKDSVGWSPLHYAIQNKLIQIVNLLIENNADIEIKDDFGNTPLWRATFSSNGNGEVIKLLISKKANVNNENDSGISPIKLANTISNYDIKQFF